MLPDWPILVVVGIPVVAMFLLVLGVCNAAGDADRLRARARKDVEHRRRVQEALDEVGDDVDATVFPENVVRLPTKAPAEVIDFPVRSDGGLWARR